MADSTLHFAGQSYVSLVTFRKDGREVATPVWFAEEEGRIWMYSEATAGKIKRLRNNGKIRLAACTFNGQVSGPWREGTARIVEDPVEFRRGIAALRNKYGWQFRIGTLLSTLTGRVNRRRVIDARVSG